MTNETRRTGSEARISCEEYDEVSSTRAEHSPGALARELFAHAMLEADAAWRAGGAAGREARVRRVLRALDEARGPAPISMVARRSLWVAAAVLVFGLVVAFWPLRSMTPAYAEKLFDRALAQAASSAHVYDIDMRFRKGRRERSMNVELALASDNRFHAKVRNGGGLVADGVEFGSNGTVLWARSRSRGKQAIELAMHDPDAQLWGRLGPELPYYELRPFLESQYGDLELQVREVVDGRVHMVGAYENESRRTERAWDEAGGEWKAVTRVVRSSGELHVEIEEQTGRLMRILRTVATERSEILGGRERRLRRYPYYPRLERFELRRRPEVLDPLAHGFDFDPPRKRNNPFWIHLSTWKRFGRALWRKVYKKRAPEAADREDAQKK